MTTSSVTARLRQVVLDSTDIRGLADFYHQLLGWPYRPGDEPPAESDFIVLRNPDGGVSVAFQPTDELAETTWPDPAVPQQLHLDLIVANSDELAAEHERVLALGARLRRDEFDDPEEPLYAYADPAGHLFCIFVAAP